MSLEGITDVGCREVTTLEALESLESEWMQLWRGCPGSTVFQSPAWLIPWWRHFGGSNLRMLCVRSEERLVGLAPLFAWHSTETGLRTVLLLGTGISDALDVLAEPGAEALVLETLRLWLSENRQEWDVCDFQELPANSLLLREPFLTELAPVLSMQSRRPVLPLPTTIEAFSDSVPSGMLEKLKYYRRRAEKCGRVAYETANAGNFRELFDALVALHTAAWQTRGKPGVLEEKSTLTLHREAAEKLLLAGALRLHGLRLNGQIIGCLYAFAAGSRTQFYLSGFDPAFAKLSPGTLLIGHAIESAIREGMEEFDFLRGEEPYKFAWGAQSQENFRLQLGPAPG